MKKSTEKLNIKSQKLNGKAKTKKFFTVSPLETENVAKVLARAVLETQLAKSARVIALVGELGSGKTTFTQGFAKGLGVREKILSPTFILMRRYELKTKNYKLKTRYFYHIDCYRLDNPVKELLYLGFKKILADPGNIVAVEWADRIKRILPKDVLWVHFKNMAENQRSITIE
ncbi:MAG: tRNA (adenosine(37)-N6)-threonylcarbamoyltransferase complex ATPase subunit type 1 TsaE [Candidatus Wildermuthbacteria bacterium RIFCSPHIGHO2_02_FULL_47_12]|uniref:tRNA threonylcarbamoyladenosine biosynthesis protein TsaE n=1 Tax=Candidatus Wildermuthbacteria bacterium RIFCSPHIGHO2_02_FULL_47_12 TaxID=1802451 RepID=A0A1G2R3I0_9BACT|nr:MAG: tRNA (adenosine(37)-N6)-threonylcarbamoyltransferase complex ATPase subunit type 1 TsaE [Candidatus Wildermuthbacteria bacterium RIFCSPHIGHO2_02_FULL_47_12]